MSIEVFRASVRIERSAEEVFAWHEKPGAFARLIAPWEKIQVISSEPGLNDGTRVILKTRTGPRWDHWEVEHRDYQPGRQFRDVALAGPFPVWDHLHRVEPITARSCVLIDEIRYRLPGGILGKTLGGGYVRRRLEKTFAYRHAQTKAEVEAARPRTPRRILVAGGSGLVGSALRPFLTLQGHDVIRLVRRPVRSADEVRWQPALGHLDARPLEGVDVVINLAGTNLADRRWTDERRREIEQSRIQATRTLVQTIQRMRTKPSLLINASAVGYYGEGGERELREGDAVGSNFLARVCEAWEREARGAEQVGVRVVCLRTGVILTEAGGMLARLAPIFRLGVGGPFGYPDHWLSWISLEDHLATMQHLMDRPELRGPVNAVGPNPVRIREFTAELGRVLHRPSWFPVPAAVLTAVFGMMAKETMLVSQRVVPTRLLEDGFVFRHPTLRHALQHGLGRLPSTVERG